MQLKTVRNVLLAIACATTACLVLVFVTRWMLFGYLTIALTVCYIVFLLVFWRCPHCHKFLGMLEKFQTCRRCGKNLEL